MSEIKPPHRFAKSIEITEVHINADQELIYITEDKLRLILEKHIETVSKKGGWITPLAILLSVITTFCTADFKEFISLSGDFWMSLFVLVGLVALIWLVISVVKSCEAMTIDDLVNKIKNKR